MAEEVRAHITGVVFQVVAGAGSAVGAGDPILILESMKMEIPVEAPRAGVVREIRVAEGQTVQEGEVIATLD
jgi:acetyl-CoA carboxylase biotin carboxyl carrier protein